MLNWLSTYVEVKESGVKTAVVPLGSIEQHGAALPLGTDYIAACALAERVALRLGAYLLPGIPVGTCQEHTGGTGSVWVSPATYLNMVQDICLSLRASGFTRIVFILGHGGLWVVKPAIRQINLTYPDISVLQICAGDLFRANTAGLLENPPGTDIHAGEGEASLMLFLAPEGVKLDKAEDNVPPVSRDFFDYVPILKFSRPGVWGTPSKGTREKGEKMIEIQSQLVADYVTETFDQIERYKKNA